MSQGITYLPLEVYLGRNEDYTRFHQSHIIAVTVSLIAAAALGFVSYMALTQGWLPLDFGSGGNLAASIGAGLGVAAVALIVILLNYSLKIAKKHQASGEEPLFEALIDPSTDQVFDKTQNHYDGKMVAWRFRQMLDRLSDENWQGMMRYFDIRFFRHQGIQYDPTIQRRVYNAFLESDPQRFIKNYFEVRSKLDPQGRKFLDPELGQMFQKLDQTGWIHWMELIDATYFRKNTSHDHEIKTLCLNFMLHISTDKFLDAYLKNKENFSPKFTALIEHNWGKLVQQTSPQVWQKIIFHKKVNETLLEQMIKQDKKRFSDIYTPLAAQCETIRQLWIEAALAEADYDSD